MNIGVIGLNQKLSSVSLREAFLKNCQTAFESLKLHDDHSFTLLATCNRVEIYFSSDDLALAHSYLLSKLNREFEQKLYSFFKKDAFRHLLRVVSGLDSMILGETEIQGQVKAAYEAASRSKPLPKSLHFLFQKALKVGKAIRSHFTWKRENTLLECLVEIGGETLLNKRTLLIGASQINETIGKHLKNGDLTLCNRTDHKGEILAKNLNMAHLPWEKFELWEEFDTVIIATKANTPLITHYKGVKPIQLFDLSVPRNVCPQLKKNPLVSLYQLDELQTLIGKKQNKKRDQIEEIERLIAYEACRYLALFEEKNPSYAFC